MESLVCVCNFSIEVKAWCAIVLFSLAHSAGRKREKERKRREREISIKKGKDVEEVKKEKKNLFYQVLTLRWSYSGYVL